MSQDSISCERIWQDQSGVGVMSQLLNEIEAMPFTCEVEIGGVLVNEDMGRQRAYERAKQGDIPTIRLGRRLYVSIPRLAELLGRPITAADIRRAEEIVRVRKRSGAVSGPARKSGSDAG
jgi:hypothetical protein